MTEQQIAFVKRIARNKNQALQFPRFGQCHRCYVSWGAVSLDESHSTPYTEWSGCFPLCHQCWTELETPEARLPFYLELVESWKDQHPEDNSYDEQWKLIEAAVMAGK